MQLSKGAPRETTTFDALASDTYPGTIRIRYSTKRGVVTKYVMVFNLDTVVDAVGISVVFIPISISAAPITFDALAFDTYPATILLFDTQPRKIRSFGYGYCN